MKRLLMIVVLFISVAAFAQKKNAASQLGYDKIYPFKNGIAKVIKNGKEGYIKDDGSIFIDCLYDKIYPWEKGRARVEIAGKYGYVNEEGEEFIPAKYIYIGPFRNGLAVISNGSGKNGLVNEAGEEIVPLD